MASLPRVAEDAREPWVEVNPFAALPPLADFHGEVAARYSRRAAPHPGHLDVHPQTPTTQASVEVPHTAPCVEAGIGTLHVFMPPAG